MVLRLLPAKLHWNRPSCFPCRSGRRCLRQTYRQNCWE